MCGIQRTSLLVLLYFGISLNVRLRVCASSDVDDGEDADFRIEIVEEDGGDSDKEVRVFEPTDEWKVVEEGQHVPPGLHIRMNLETGLKEAKLLADDSEPEATSIPQHAHNVHNVGMSPSEKQSSFRFDGDKRRQHHYGKSDQRGIINKKTMPVTRKQLHEMMQSDSEVLNEGMPLRLASSTSGSVTRNTPDQSLNKENPSVHFPERNLPGVTFTEETRAMLQHIQVLVNPESEILNLIHALEHLEYHVHEIDNAMVLNDIGGLTVLVRLLNHSHSNIRSWAAQVIGSASQSNPKVQDQVTSYGGLKLLCALMKATEPELVQRRTLYAIGALLRGSISFQYNFVKDAECQGLVVLGDDFANRSPHVQLKAVTILTDIINEQYLLSTVDLQHYISAHGWCSHVTTLLYDDSLPRIEKALLAMDALTTTCNFTVHKSRIQELIHRFQELLKMDQDNEYMEDLVQLSLNQLQNIRDINKEL